MTKQAIILIISIVVLLGAALFTGVWLTSMRSGDDSSQTEEATQEETTPTNELAEQAEAAAAAGETQEAIDLYTQVKETAEAEGDTETAMAAEADIATLRTILESESETGESAIEEAQ